MSSFTEDNAQAQINAKVKEVKKAIDWDEDNQSPDYSGHEGAPYGPGPDKSAARPGGSPGTGRSDSSY